MIGYYKENLDGILHYISPKEVRQNMIVNVVGRTFRADIFDKQTLELVEEDVECTYIAQTVWKDSRIFKITSDINVN